MLHGKVPGLGGEPSNYLYEKVLEAQTVSSYTAVKYQALFTVLNKCKNNNKQR